MTFVPLQWMRDEDQRPLVAVCQRRQDTPNLCVCVCVCVRVFVTNQDIDLYNDTGMTQVLQGEGDFSGH